MKKFLFLFAAVAVLAFTGCSKDDDEDFAYGIEDLYGMWDGIAIEVGGKWDDITGCPFDEFAFSATFRENGSYSGAYFGTGSGTYEAKGDMIYTYIDGEEFANYQVRSLSNGIAEMTMGGESGSDERLAIRAEKR